MSNADEFDHIKIDAHELEHSIHFGFSNTNDAHDDPKWEVVIGGWDGRKSVIRDRVRNNINFSYNILKLMQKICVEKIKIFMPFSSSDKGPESGGEPGGK